MAPSTRTKTTTAIQKMNLKRFAWSSAMGPAVPNVDWALSGVHAARRANAIGASSSRVGRREMEGLETRCIWER